MSTSGTESGRAVVKLAIAASTFDAPSETFIRDHVRMIAPGQTALLCLSEDGAKGFDLPSIDGLRPGWRSSGPIHRRLLNELRNRWGSYVGPRLSRSERRRLLDFLDETRPSAVLAEYGPTGCILMDPCTEANVPLYVHFHGYDANILPKKSLISIYYRGLFARAAGIIVTSEFLRQRLLRLGCPAGKLHVSPCGVDTQRFAPLPSKRPGKRILMVSRMIPQKGPLQSIGSFASMLPRHPGAVLEVIGSGHLLSRAMREAERLGVAGHVTFHGAKPHDFVLDRLQAADILIQHCITRPFGGIELLGLSLIEAMACAVPVVATRHGAIPDTVEDGVTGILVDEHDVKGMADAMAALLDDPARAEAMGKAGRARVLGRFTLEQSRDRLRAIMGLAAIADAEATCRGPADRA